jgi:predicted RNase H-like HicB family nuclease
MLRLFLLFLAVTPRVKPLEEAERNVKEAISLYLESLAAHGEEIPEEGRSFQGRVTVPISIPA